MKSGLAFAMMPAPGVQRAGTCYLESGGYQAIEIDWQAATGAGSNNGKLTLWVDGQQKETVSGINNDTQRVDYVRLGAVSGIDSGTYYFDSFVSNRQGYVGLGHSIPVDNYLDASFVYDGDGKRVKAEENGITRVYIGKYFEKEINGQMNPGEVPNPGFEGTWGIGSQHSGSYAYTIHNLTCDGSPP